MFEAGGPLARAVPDYRPRPQQLEMARAILTAIEREAPLLIEAGTGTGKTFAYLVPALLGGGRVIISTGTKTLQNQLYDRDLPAVRAALASGAVPALLKGRANYVCRYRLQQALNEARLATRDEASQLRRIERFAAASAHGDRAELADLAEDAPVWMHATSTRENCLGQDCPQHAECFVMQARKRALEADVVVINHHLFFADVVLRDEGVGELLPAANTVILDEAHQLPDLAREFFGKRCSSTQWIELARDARIELRAAGGASPELEEGARRLETAAREFRLALGDATGRFSWAALERRRGVAPALEAVEAALDALAGRLEAQAERSQGLNAVSRRAADARTLLSQLRSADAKTDIRWAEVYAQSVQLHLTPMSSSAQFARQVAESSAAWILTSATLAVNGDFALIAQELGLQDAAAQSWASPFDYARQALLYAPQGLPEDPNDPAFTDAVVDAALPVLRASRGRAFLLFTSLRALRRAHERIAAHFAEAEIDYPLLVQGTGSRSELLERFRAAGNAVLLGSHSFWEGVDVRGDALSVVMIDKLPFAPPDDPILSARIDALREQGGNPFVELQLPRAILQLKQGVGRLIRDQNDRGILMICDPRLFTRSYGRAVRASLPPMPVTRDLSDVQSFFARSATIARDPPERHHEP